MRLRGRLKNKIISALDIAFPHNQIRLFGSRVDDSKQGGDIDIVVYTSVSSEHFKQQKIQFFTDLMRSDLDLKIDLVQYHDAMDPLLKEEIDNNSIAL